MAINKNSVKVTARLGRQEAEIFDALPGKSQAEKVRFLIRLAAAKAADQAGQDELIERIKTEVFSARPAAPATESQASADALSAAEARKIFHQIFHLLSLNFYCLQSGGIEAARDKNSMSNSIGERVLKGEFQ
ncbi:hypothetical protein NB640_04245 [Oxalobacter vibrioformis]|uniref:Uncharacterized protein n=1 Tax=Oxalobacter vibrioformis TaxID=933080 RepID=A0A9E9M109_9BURK|nr:hypothetical protein [Oxalobacter vibrioformis]WAW10863.1 hypothetical protein NB640_04245 [Oxalobacter vibrioformis]